MDLFCLGPQCFLWPPVRKYLLLYSTLLCKKIARAPGGQKRFILTKLEGGGNRIDPYILIKNLYKFLLPLLAALIYPSIRVTHTLLTVCLWIKINNNQFQSGEVIFESELSCVTKKLITQMNTKTRTTKSEKWHHARTSVKIARTNEQKTHLKWLWCHIVVTKIMTK